MNHHHDDLSQELTDEAQYFDYSSASNPLLQKLIMSIPEATRGAVQAAVAAKILGGAEAQSTEGRCTTRQSARRRLLRRSWIRMCRS
jgi:hypothetical protein